MPTSANVIWGARCGKPARRVLLGETRTRGHAYSVRRRRESACDRKAPHRLQSSRLVSTNLKGGVCRGDTGIDRGLEKRFFDIADLQAVQQSRTDMNTKFFPTPKGCHHDKREQATCSVVESRPGPDCSPCIFRNKFLKIFGEICFVGDRAIHVRVPQGPTPYLKTGVQSFLGRVCQWSK